MKTVLAIGTHPDDIEIGCGGAVALLAAKGYRVVHVVVTSGEEGSNQVPQAELKQQREAEARAAAQVLGAKEVVFLGLPDSLTSFSKADKIRLINVIRQHQPEIIFTHAADDVFPDHKIIHDLSMAAITAAAGPWFQNAEGAPHTVSEVYGYEVWHPIQHYQTTVTIDAVMDQKLKALQCHASQIKDVDYVSAVHGLAAYRGAMSMTGKYAEVFTVMRTASLPNKLG